MISPQDFLLSYPARCAAYSSIRPLNRTPGLWFLLPLEAKDWRIKALLSMGVEVVLFVRNVADSDALWNAAAHFQDWADSCST